MKSIKKFKTNELLDAKLTIIFGGQKRATCFLDTYCDVHHDSDGDGVIDPGECFELVEC